MKKLLLLFAIITTFIICLTPSFATDSESVESVRIVPTAENFVVLNSPTNVACDETYTVIADNDNLYIIDDLNIRTINNISAISHCIIGDYIVTIDIDYNITAFNIEDLTTSTITLSITPAEVFSFGNIIYFHAYNNIYYYELDTNADDFTLINELVITNTEFIRSESFTASNNKIFYYSPLTKLKYYDLNLNNTTLALDITGITSIEFNNDILYYLHGQVLTAYDLNTYTSTDISVDSPSDTSSTIAANSNNLFIVSNTRDLVYCYDSVNYALLSLYGSYGNGTNALHDPTCIYQRDGLTYIADKTNNRIIVYNNNVFVEEYNIANPEKIAISTNKIFASVGNSIIDVSSNLTFTASNMGDIISLAIDKFDNCYALDNLGKVWRTHSNGTLSLFFTEQGSTAIAISEHGTGLYLIGNGRLVNISASGEILLSTNFNDIALTDCEVKDMNIDYYGNVYILTINASSSYIHYIKHDYSSFTATKIYEPLLQGNLFESDSFTFTASGDILLLSSSSHSIFSISSASFEIITENSATQITPPINLENKEPILEPLVVCTLRESNSTIFLYENPSNFEIASAVPTDAYILKFAISSTFSDYSYVYLNEEYGYINNNDLVQTIQGIPYISQGIALYSSFLYKYPIENSEYELLSILKDTNFGILSELTSFDNGKWCLVSYNESIYYINTINIGEPPRPTPDQYYYARIKTNTIGIPVKVYAIASTEGSILTELIDGTEIKLSAPLNIADTYTRITFEDFVGYVLTENLTENGLTSAQIVILTLIGILSLTTIFMYTYLRKRKRRKSFE